MRQWHLNVELLIWLWLAAMVIPSVYVLSVGPVVGLQTHGYLSASVSVIYAPLSWLCDRCEPLYEAMEWYVEFWK